MTRLFFYLTLSFFCFSYGQTYWQQHVDYKMDVNMNVKNFQYTGTQTIVYKNNSPDTLKNIYFHLFYNAFHPGSEMAVRIKSGKDKNSRFKEDIDSLSKKEMGLLNVISVAQNGVLLEIEEAETILEVTLDSPLPPNSSTKLETVFKGQVPKLIRRGGRNSKENVALSMSQWFPKIAEYDYDGWNSEPYLGREFHGVWGNFDVKITIDKKYIIGGSGYLQNPQEIGAGYTEEYKRKTKKGKLTWHFYAPNVHDFTWAADPEYIHDIVDGPNDVKLHFFYKNNDKIIENWKKLQPLTMELMEYFNNAIGEYPYKQYSVIQGGDGGMEYAMCTLITGERKFGSLVGVTAHELAHSWFQHLLATNEMKHEWMDEGFTTYISTLAKNKVLKENNPFPLKRAYDGYFYLANSGVEQPQATNANRYDYNFAYESTAYSKGAVFLAQLEYIIGKENLSKTLKEYYNEFKFKHPTPNDFRRVAERVSNIHLKWYLTDWTQTTNTIDYKIADVSAVDEEKTKVKLERVSSMPMPLDILITQKDGSKSFYYIPLRIMRGEKEKPEEISFWSVQKDWAWAFPTYEFTINIPIEKIKTIEIDPSFRMADIDRSNNVFGLDKKNASLE